MSNDPRRNRGITGLIGLPIDVKTLILEHSPDFASLDSFVVCSREIYDAYKMFERQIRVSVLRRMLSAEAEEAAVLLYKAQSLADDGNIGEFVKERFERTEATIPPCRSRISSLRITSDSARQILRNHQIATTVTRHFLEKLLTEITTVAPIKRPMLPPTETEYQRVYTAVCRLWLLFVLCAEGTKGLKDAGILSDPDQPIATEYSATSDAFRKIMDSYGFWGGRTVMCVYKYLEEEVIKAATRLLEIWGFGLDVASPPPGASLDGSPPKNPFPRNVFISPGLEEVTPCLFGGVDEKEATERLTKLFLMDAVDDFFFLIADAYETRVLSNRSGAKPPEPLRVFRVPGVSLIGKNDGWPYGWMLDGRQAEVGGCVFDDWRLEEWGFYLPELHH